MKCVWQFTSNKQTLVRHTSGGNKNSTYWILMKSFSQHNTKVHHPLFMYDLTVLSRAQTTQYKSKQKWWIMKRKGCERNWSLPTQEELFQRLPGCITENHNMSCLQSPMCQQFLQSTTNCSLHATIFSFTQQCVLYINIHKIRSRTTRTTGNITMA